MTALEQIALSRAQTLRRAAWTRSKMGKVYHIAHHENRVRDALKPYPPHIAAEIIETETRDLNLKLGVDE